MPPLVDENTIEIVSRSHAAPPGARLPHVWLVRDRQNHSSLDVTGHGQFTLLTGIGGEDWRGAAEAVTAAAGEPKSFLLPDIA